jgi:hypothetical protein
LVIAGLVLKITKTVIKIVIVPKRRRHSGEEGTKQSAFSEDKQAREGKDTLRSFLTMLHLL